jgi:hypothetical protein
MKFDAQTGALGFRTDFSLSDIEFGGGTNLNLKAQGSNGASLVFTSDQGL